MKENNPQGWNRPHEVQCEECGAQGRKRGVMRGALAGLCVAALAGVVLWFLVPDGGEPSRAEAPGAARKISQAKPAKEPRPAQADVARVEKADVLPLPKPSGRRIETREAVAEPQPLEEMANALTNGTKAAKKKNYVPFKNGAEQLIALATPSSPGEPVPPLPMITDEGLAKDVEAAMDHVISAHEQDTEQTLEKKIVVSDAKEEFRELREKEGWTFSQYLNALRDKANLDYEFLSEAHRLCKELYHDATVPDEDYIKYRDQVNEKLRERGLPEIDGEADRKEVEK